MAKLNDVKSQVMDDIYDENLCADKISTCDVIEYLLDILTDDQLTLFAEDYGYEIE